MAIYHKILTLVALSTWLVTKPYAQHQNAHRSSVKLDVEPFEVNLSDRVPRLRNLASNTLLPSKPEFPEAGSAFGIDLDFLKSLQEEWLGDFNWDQEQANLNQ